MALYCVSKDWTHFDAISDIGNQLFLDLFTINSYEATGQKVFCKQTTDFILMELLVLKPPTWK